LLAASLGVEGRQTSANRQGGSNDEPQPPVFRANVQSVDVDVIVTDRDGRFVTGLTADDFEISEDGIRQDVRTFSFVDLPTSRVAIDSDKRPFDEDAVAEGRQFVMILNGHGPRLARAASLFVDQALSPNDRMAIYYNNPINNRFVEGQQFTASKPLLRAVIRRVEPAFMPFQPPPMTGFMNRQQLNNERDRIQLERFEMLKRAMEQIASTPGRKKAILWIGGVFPFDFSRSQRGPELALAYRDIIDTAQRKHVVIYPIDPTGLTTSTGRRELTRMAAFRVLAEDTGVEAIVGTNDFEKGYARIVREMSTYYLLGYSPAINHEDGEFHSIRVHVKRPNVSVRARKGYYAYRTLPEPPAAPRAPAAVEIALYVLSDTLSRPVDQIAADGQVAPSRTERVPAMVLGEPTFLRADSRAQYARTANPRFTRTERLRLEIPANTPAAASARLLDRRGAPLALAPAVGHRVDESDGRRWIVVDLSLAPLAQGDYVIEIIAGEATRLAAFQVVR
jgi:Ca-activated chloride channel family protein